MDTEAQKIAVYRSALIELYRRDFRKYAAEQLWIRGAQPGEVLPFKFKTMQEHMWKLESRQLKEKGYIRAVIVKPRQGGSSTLAQGIMFWQASLNKNFSCLLLALDDDNTQNIFNMSRFYYEHLDDLIRPETRYCVDDETECLTKQGWTNYKNLNIGDDIYTLNPETGKGEWTPVLNIFLDENYDGPMVRWPSKDIDALITPDHKWLVTTWYRKDRPFGISRAGSGGDQKVNPELRLRYSVVPTLELGMMYIIPTAAAIEQEEYPISDGLLELLGWTIAEGCFFRKHEVRISQSKKANPEKVERIKKAIQLWGAPLIEYKARPDMALFSFAGEWGDAIRELLPEKRFKSEFISRLSARQANLLLDTLVAGDGSDHGVHRCYWTADKLLAPQVQMIAALAGTPSRIGKAGKQPINRKRALPRYGDGLCIGLHGKPVAWVSKLQKKQDIIDYKGVIWCPQTKTGTWLARRGTTTYFTHNSSKREIVFDADKRRNVNAVGLGSSMQFQNSTRIQAGTGTTRHGVHISEASKFNPDACSLLEHSLMPAIHLLPGTIIINESTTFVTGDWFRGCCERARSGLSEFILIFVPWWFEPEYQVPLSKGERFKLTKEERWIAALAKRGQPEYQVDPFDVRPEQFKWRRLIIASRQDGEKFFPQEYPHNFEDAWINMDLYVFDRVRCHEAERQIKNPIILGDVFEGPKVLSTNTLFSEEKNYLAIWKEPQKGKKYDIGADVAVGVEGGDWSAAEVFDRETHEQVAEFHAHLDVFEFAEKLYWLGYYYNVAQICVEINSIGSSVHGRLASMAYPYLYRWRHRDRDVPQITKLGGWYTAKNSKPHLVALYRTWFHREQITIHSRLLLEEMRDFVTIPSFSDFGGDQYRAQRGHDDLVMAAGMALISGDDENYGIARGPQAIPEVMDQDSIAKRIKMGPWTRDTNMGKAVGNGNFEQELANSLRGWK